MEEPLVRCLMVETGEEGRVMQLLRVRQLGRGMFPQRVRIRKIRGVWRKDRMRLMPGYVFVFSDEEIPVRSYQGMEHVLKVLRYEREPEGYLHGADLDFARTICELDGKLDVLNAVDEDGFIRITDTLLKQLHGEVASVDRQKRQVRIRFSLMGQTKILLMNYQLLGEDGLPLDPVTEMLDDESDDWFTAWTPDFADSLAEQMDLEAEKNSGPGEMSLPDETGPEAGEEPGPGRKTDPDGPELSGKMEETEADVKDFAEKDGSEGEGKHESRT
ncbi:MAG: hypothetical protein K5922_06575 [Clostridiales bacterium]|nr:hypothetical protein [Clostridiales bacterium]